MFRFQVDEVIELRLLEGQVRRYCRWRNRGVRHPSADQPRDCVRVGSHFWPDGSIESMWPWLPSARDCRLRDSSLLQRAMNLREKTI